MPAPSSSTSFRATAWMPRTCRPGRGAATSIGEALAALHALPLSIVRTEGLPVRTPQQVRDDVVATASIAPRRRGRAAARSLDRWRRAVDADELWRFESAVVLGGAGAASFLFEDVDGVPARDRRARVARPVGGRPRDRPAVARLGARGRRRRLRRVRRAQRPRSRRAACAQRARLYAELEFAKWLVHGHEAGRDDIVDDAVGLLESLAAGVRDDDIVPDAALGVDDAIALLDRVPDAAAGRRWTPRCRPTRTTPRSCRCG